MSSVSDAIGDRFRASVKKFSVDVARAEDAALRSAWTKNECPQCHAGVHPEALVILYSLDFAAKFNDQTQAVASWFLVCCVRCVGRMVPYEA